MIFFLIGIFLAGMFVIESIRNQSYLFQNLALGIVSLLFSLPQSYRFWEIGREKEIENWIDTTAVFLMLPFIGTILLLSLGTFFGDSYSDGGYALLVIFTLFVPPYVLGFIGVVINLVRSYRTRHPLLTQEAFQRKNTLISYLSIFSFVMGIVSVMSIYLGALGPEILVLPSLGIVVGLWTYFDMRRIGVGRKWMPLSGIILSVLGIVLRVFL